MVIRMKPSSLSKEAVLKAMAVFDRELRGTAEWEGWRENKAHKYAIDRAGQLYPVKKIASMASSVPVSDFSGGRRHANQLLEKIDFKIVDLRPSNPDWVRDELILALNIYLKHRPNLPGKDSEDILSLSTLLNRLGEKLFSPEERSDTFRNVNGVYMKLMNFRRLDPQYTAGGRMGLVRGAKAEEEVWAEFASEMPSINVIALGSNRASRL
jgi:predicted HNH restriction endonuclease